MLSGGGTALHKLYLNPAQRYSEDFDLVQVREGPIKPIIERIGKVITFFEEDRRTKIRGHGAKALYRFTSEYENEPGPLKIEINCKEHFKVLKWMEFPFNMANPWFSGRADIRTYGLDELLGTKLRALYQRSKGRDLFDLDYSRRNTDINIDKIIKCFKAYMEFSAGRVPSQKEFLHNMEAKEDDAAFEGDMEGLLRPEIPYDQKAAFLWLKETVVPQM